MSCGNYIPEIGREVENCAGYYILRWTMTVGTVDSVVNYGVRTTPYMNDGLNRFPET